MKHYNDILGCNLPAFCSIDGSEPRLVTKLVHRERFYVSYYNSEIGIKEICVKPALIQPLEFADDLPLFLNPIISNIHNSARNQFWAIGPYCWGRGLEEDYAIENCLQNYSCPPRGTVKRKTRIIVYELKPFATAYICSMGTFYTYDDDIIRKTVYTMTRKAQAPKILRLVEKLEDEGVFWEIPSSELYDWREESSEFAKAGHKVRC